MPLHHTKPSPHPGSDALLAGLVAELRTPSAADSEADALPLIFEDEEARSSRFAVTIIWDKWSEVALAERGEVIMDAYREARGEDEARKITRCLGLTHDEAAKVGLDRLYGLA